MRNLIIQPWCQVIIVVCRCRHLEDIYEGFEHTLNHLQNAIYQYTIDFFIYSLFHKTLPKSSLQMRWISVRFY